MKNIAKYISGSIVLLIFYTLIILYSPLGDIIKNKRTEIQYFKEIRKDPNNGNNYARLNILYFQEEKYEKALEIQKKLIKNTKAKVNDYVVLADLYMEIDKEGKTHKDSAMKYLKETQTWPDLSVYDLILIGNSFEKLGEDSLAIKAFDKALNVFSKDSAEYYNRLKTQILNNIKAVKEIQEIQSRSPSKDTAYIITLSKDTMEFIKVPPKNDSME